MIVSTNKFYVDIDPKSGEEFAGLNTADTSVMVYPVSEHNGVYLIKKYMPASGTVELVLPGGRLNDGEDPIVAVSRELKEETGLESDSIDFLGELKVLPRYFRGRTLGFLARRVYGNPAVEDLDEAQAVVFLPYLKLLEKIKSGEVSDARTVALTLFVRTFYS